MQFFTQNGLVRPVRLSKGTRKFAYDSLNRKYGLDTRRVMSISLDDVADFEKLSKLEQQDLAIQRVVAEAPIRICENERISGAATLGMAIKARVPARYGDVEGLGFCASHLTLDFSSVLRHGVNGIRRRAEQALQTYVGSDREPFARSCVACIDALELWHGRYLDALKDREEYRANYENLLRVPFEPAKSFYEAVQSIWFVFAFVRLLGNWPGFGRLDEMLGPYLKQDLASGAITLDEAREILAHFFIKGCEWINGQEIGSGDAQHYQNIVLAGVDRDGNEVTNEVTYLVLDVIEELGISDFPTTVRLNRNTDEALLRRIAEVTRLGGGILAVYNEETVIEALVKDGYDECEAREFANDGCWEVQIPGKTNFIYQPFDSLRLLQTRTLGSYRDCKEYPDFESLYQTYLKDLRVPLAEIFERKYKEFYPREAGDGEWRWYIDRPCTPVSLFEQGCIERGLCYYEGGPIYNLYAPHIGGLADTVNSLYAIKKMVYDEKRISLSALMETLARNWEGDEPLRQYALNRYTYYGNDNDEVDLLAARLLSDFSDLCRELDGRCGYRFPAGVSTFGRQLEWSPYRLAAAHGRRKGEVLAANCSPTPNSDREGATAIVRSYCKLDHTKLPTGAALDLRLLPSSVSGEDGLAALIGLMRGFVSLGGFFMQPDVVDASLLREAQEHPEDYLTLSVRVSGWNARFVTLDRQWQDMVIAQNEH